MFGVRLAVKLDHKLMLKIQRAAEAKGVVLTLSGRIDDEGLAELQKLLESETEDHLILDLKEVKLVDREAVSFLADCEAKGITLANCPAYIREWIERESC
jgi:anti-anti-sigma regulatory factor